MSGVLSSTSRRDHEDQGTPTWMAASPLAPSAPPSTGQGSRTPSSLRLSRRFGQQLLLALAICGVLGGFGALVGFVVANDEVESEYEASASLDLADYVPMESWQADARAGRFAQTIARRDIRETAADAAGVPASELTRTDIDQVDDTSTVTVVLTTRGRDDASRGVMELLRASFSDLLDGERNDATEVIAGDGERLAELDATLDRLATEAGLAPGTDLADAFNSQTRRFDAASAELELVDAESPDWLISELTGRQAAAAAALERLQPVIEQWSLAAREADELRPEVEDAVDELAEVDAGSERLARLEQELEVSVLEIAASRSAGRSAAGGAALGVGIGLAIVAIAWPLRRRDPSAIP